MVATFGPAKCRVVMEETIGPRMPWHKPKTITYAHSSTSQGWNEIVSSSATPSAEPQKLTPTVRLTPNRSASGPLAATLATDNIPVTPNAVAATTGENPASIKNTTDCTSTVN